METMTETTVEREVAIAAPPETVWRFLIEPELAALHQRGQGGTVFGANHNLDTQPGRRFHEVVRAIGAARDQQKDARHQC